MGFKTRENHLYDDMSEEMGLQSEKEYQDNIKGKFGIDSIELQEFLDNLDFDCLNEIIRDIAVKCGADPSGINFLDRSNIFHAKMVVEEIQQGTILASYNPLVNLVNLNIPAIFEKSEIKKTDKYLTLLHVVCHELTHSFSKQTLNVELSESVEELNLIRKILKKTPKKTEIYQVDRRSGYSHISERISSNERGNKKLMKKVLFEFLNEGITEKLSREIFKEYLRRQGYNDKMALENFEKKGFSSYQGELYFIDKFVHKLSKLNGVDEDTVWKSLISSYVSGEDLYNGEVRKLFDEVFGDDFMEALAKAETSEDFESLISTYLE